MTMHIAEEFSLNKRADGQHEATKRGNKRHRSLIEYFTPSKMFNRTILCQAHGDSGDQWSVYGNAREEPNTIDSRNRPSERAFIMSIFIRSPFCDGTRAACILTDLADFQRRRALACRSAVAVHDSKCEIASAAKSRVIVMKWRRSSRH